MASPSNEEVSKTGVDDARALPVESETGAIAERSKRLDQLCFAQA